jgi:hypothetical protein
LKYFEYGEQKEGYWNYNHMVCQFKDCVDILKVMHPNYLYVFLFEHLLGHAKQRPDGLNAANMNKSFGGKCPHMRSTLFEHAWEFLGPLTMNPGQRQHLVFQEAESGPFWMTPTERKHVVMRLLPL